MWTVDMLLRGCRVEGIETLIEIALQDGSIIALGAGLELEGVEELDVGGRLVSPAFVQPHIHLDKVLSAAAVGVNATGTLSEAIARLHAAKRTATVDQVATRAGIVIR